MYPEYVSVALVIHHAKPCAVEFFHIIAGYFSTLSVGYKKKITINVFFDFLYNFCLKNFSFQEELH